ncbi:bile acid:sodium symporter [Bacillus sp. SM2101]|uniref:arsenic resistance protein n=1 Tax=Bacillus sp. SM2101 TaxID=2805366 RepID=UPI001BDE79C4|nr:bile acid:sodium symporter [Bacillus sp. SM2101]
MRMIYTFPQRFLHLSIPLTLVLGFIIGISTDTSFLKPTILYATIMMIYTSLVGLKLKELSSFKGSKILLYSMMINFLFIPAIALLIGKTLLNEYPNMFAGLVLLALLPTSGMTISWTSMQKGNVHAAIKLTVFSLILGSLLTPIYLLIMVGEFININMFEIFSTILLVVFLPMLLGHITFKVILKKYTLDQFQQKIKPNITPLSIWSMLYVVFVSISMKAEMIVSKPQLIIFALIVLVLFYLVNYIISTVIAKRLLNRSDGIALVNGVALRNLSIAIGLAATSFGADAALIVTLAFIVQQQGHVYYIKYAKKYWFNQQQQRTLTQRTTIG